MFSPRQSNGGSHPVGGGAVEYGVAEENPRFFQVLLKILCVYRKVNMEMTLLSEIFAATLCYPATCQMVPTACSVSVAQKSGGILSNTCAGASRGLRQ